MLRLTPEVFQPWSLPAWYELALVQCRSSVVLGEALTLSAVATAENRVCLGIIIRFRMRKQRFGIVFHLTFTMSVIYITLSTN